VSLKPSKTALAEAFAPHDSWGFSLPRPAQRVQMALCRAALAAPRGSPRPGWPSYRKPWRCTTLASGHAWLAALAARLAGTT